MSACMYVCIFNYGNLKTSNSYQSGLDISKLEVLSCDKHVTHQVGHGKAVGARLLSRGLNSGRLRISCCLSEEDSALEMRRSLVIT